MDDDGRAATYLREHVGKNRLRCAVDGVFGQRSKIQDISHVQLLQFSSSCEIYQSRYGPRPNFAADHRRQWERLALTPSALEL